MSAITLSKTSKLSASEKMDIFHIWNTVYPAQITHNTIADLDKYLATIGNTTHTLAKINERTVGWLSTFDRNNDRWFAIIVDPGHQRRSIGTRLMHELQTTEQKVYGWIVLEDNYIKRDGSVYLSPKEFYKKFDFVITDEFFASDALTTTKIYWQSRK